MPSREYYLQQAKMCFDMASRTGDKAMADRWITRANEYLILANAMGDDPPPPAGNVTQPVQQQQQQQSKDDKDE